MNFEAMIKEGISKGLVKLEQIVNQDTRTQIIPNGSENLTYEQALKKLDTAIFDNALTTQDLEKMWYYLRDEIANQINPNLEIDNSILAWYYKAKEIRSIKLLGIYAYVEASHEFVVELLKKVQSFNPKLAEETISFISSSLYKDEKIAIAFFEHGFSLYVNTFIVGFVKKIFFYKNLLIKVHTFNFDSDRIEFIFDNPINDDFKNKIIDAYFLFMEECYFFYEIFWIQGSYMRNDFKEFAILEEFENERRRFIKYRRQ